MFGDSLVKKVVSSRRSLRFASKKDKNKGTKNELVPLTGGPAETKREEMEEEEVQEEVAEAYVLPDIPLIPLSGKITLTFLY